MGKVKKKVNLGVLGASPYVSKGGTLIMLGPKSEKSLFIT